MSDPVRRLLADYIEARIDLAMDSGDLVSEVRKAVEDGKRRAADLGITWDDRLVTQWALDMLAEAES